MRSSSSLCVLLLLFLIKVQIIVHLHLHMKYLSCLHLLPLFILLDVFFFRFIRTTEHVGCTLVFPTDERFHVGHQQRELLHSETSTTIE